LALFQKFWKNVKWLLPTLDGLLLFQECSISGLAAKNGFLLIALDAQSPLT
jgi:hypothetical protein